jgi:hypothetical protein
MQNEVVIGYILYTNILADESLTVEARRWERLESGWERMEAATGGVPGEKSTHKKALIKSTHKKHS